MKLPPRFDPGDPAVVRDPYAAYARLRSACRIARGGPGQVVVPHYRDVAALLRSDRLSNRFPAEYRKFSLGSGPASGFLSNVLLHLDPPEHRALRQLLSIPLGRGALKDLAPKVNALADELLQEALRHDRFDAASALAMPLPILVICELLGVPAEDRHALRHNGIGLERAFKLLADEDDRRLANESVESLRDYVRRRLTHQTTRPGTVLLTEARALLAAGADFDVIVDNLVFLVFAGFETTTSLIAAGCARLAERPDVFRRLRASPQSVPAFLRETLRFDPPIQSRARVVSEPVRIGERTVRPGRIVVLLIGSANRDPEIFDRPDVFDIDRTRNPHLSFGGGRHHCLGAQLALLEATVLFEKLLERCPQFEADGPATLNVNSVFRSLESVPIRHRSTQALSVC